LITHKIARALFQDQEKRQDGELEVKKKPKKGRTHNIAICHGTYFIIAITVALTDA
jgi:hypothetical protein